MRVLLVVGMLLLAACSSPSRVVILQHLQTKQTVECRVDPWGDVNRTAQINACVSAYKKSGYEVVGDSHPSN